MKNSGTGFLLFAAGLLLGGCVTSDRSDYLPCYAHEIRKHWVLELQRGIGAARDPHQEHG